MSITEEERETAREVVSGAVSVALLIRKGLVRGIRECISISEATVAEWPGKLDKQSQAIIQALHEKLAREDLDRTAMIVVNKGMAGEEWRGSVGEFLLLNPDDEDLLLEIYNLRPGQVFRGGGGAAPEFTIELEAS
jgi:hypothetical protein